MPIERRVFQIVYNDGRIEEHRLTPAAEMRFERTYKIGVNQAFTGEQSSTYLSRMAWELVRAKTSEVIPAFEDWIESVDTINVEKERVAPFAVDRPDTSSPSSPAPPG